MAKTSSTVKNRHNFKTYDRVNLVVIKGKKEIIQIHAVDQKESLNGFINHAIGETMERDKNASICKQTEAVSVNN